MLTATPLAAGNDAYVESMYESYLADPGSVGAHWREYFAGLGAAARDVAHGPLIDELAARARVPRGARDPAGTNAPAGAPPAGDSLAAKQAAVSRLIQVYANRGHLVANIDPLGLMVAPDAEGAGAGLPRPDRGRPRHRVLHGQPQRGRQAAPEAA